MKQKELAQYIDAALLTPKATRADVKKLCAQANKYGFAGVDTLPCFIPLTKKLLKGKTKIVAVVGYPLGGNTPEVKMFETFQAVRDGADEIDMVMNVGQFKGKEFVAVRKDIKAVVEAAQGRPVKVIIETGYLTKGEIVKASKLVKSSGAQFVKTGSGWGPRGATVQDVRLIRKTVPNMGVKAAGGIRTTKQALDLIRAGATRLGASAAVDIVKGLK